MLDTLLALKDENAVRGAIEELGVETIHNIISLRESDIKELVYQNPDSKEEDAKTIPVHAVGMFLTLNSSVG